MQGGRPVKRSPTEGANPLRIVPLAAESLGVRSMATWVETPDVRILIDPGAALAPLRQGLSPHQQEILALESAWRKIRDRALKAEVLIITHYHYDHLNPDQVDLFQGKLLWLKDPTRTNRSQRTRARAFLDRLKNVKATWTWADGHTFHIGHTHIHFSEPTPHGPGGRLGTVIQVAIESRGRSFVYTSDIQGPFRDDQLAFILAHAPQCVYLDGPPLYLLGQHYSTTIFEKVLENLQEILATVDTVILDHHPLRVANWRSYFHRLTGTSRMVSAAEFLGHLERLLEANRRALYSDAVPM